MLCAAMIGGLLSLAPGSDEDISKPPALIYDMMKAEVLNKRTYLEAMNRFRQKCFDLSPRDQAVWEKKAASLYRKLSKASDGLEDDRVFDEDIGIQGGDLVPEIEPNDDTSSATSLELGQIGEGSIATEPDLDYWTFTTTEPLGVIFGVDSQDPALDPQLRLFNASGVELVFDDDDGPAFDPRIVTYLPAGTYFLLVQSFNQMSLGSYRLLTQGTSALFSLRGREVIDDALENSGDVAFYQFTAPQESEVDLLTVTLGSGLDSRLVLCDAEGFVLEEDDDSGAEWDARLRTSVDAGVYVAAVDSWSGSGRGSYQFANFVAPLRQPTGQEQEPNDDEDNGNPLSCCSILGAAIESPTDRDSFDFVSDINTRLILEISPFIGSSVDPALFVFDANGAEIGFDDDSGPGFGSRIELELPAGEYRVLVTSMDNTTGAYSISSTCVPAFTPLSTELEPNNDIATANEVLFGQGHAGEIDGLGDADYFLLVAETQIEVDFLVSTPGSDLDPEIELLDAGGNRLYGDDDGGVGTDSALRGLLLRPGIYFVRISAFGDASTGEYVFAPESSYILPDRVVAGQSNLMFLRARQGDYFFILTGTQAGSIRTRFGTQLIDPARFTLVDQVPPCGWIPIQVDLGADFQNDFFLTQAISGNIVYDGARFTNILNVDIQ